VAGIPIYRTAVQPEWIDYNGHLRDAYYGLIVSLATDALMDRIGLDADYRLRTGGTLYTLELHLHYLQEIKRTETVEVAVRIAGLDRKRIHAAFELTRTGEAALAASAEVMLMHVVQRDGHAGSAPFPPSVSAALAALATQSATLQASGPGSRQMQLPRPRGAS
jgi:acyl-CoA thioester hydrolase